MVTCNGKLVFFINSKLWESDATPNGTHTVTDNIFAGLVLDDPDDHLASVGDHLFFVAASRQYDDELYAGTISKPGSVLYISAASGNWNNPATWVGNTVPPEGASVIIRHDVIGNVNTTCNGLRVEEPGKLIMNAGVSIKVLK